ncbi:protein kinase domain-containing protein [Candidatus Uabimicrobium amorphum]|uniref:Protein kinase n=1 Tax=Uabimicrobium amorphum TaxID=2596890 RepID=A0A5S9F5F2_UABAM|nr:protein kinase [Candidatus Uabimicrobium amorphum]BBM86795.1 protein kinase [Candidatus Uabimicrobium amorphum]
MPVNNRFLASIQNMDTRSEVAKHSFATTEIIVVDISDLLWTAKEKNTAQSKISPVYQCKVVGEIVVANRQMILPDDFLVLTPKISSTMKSLEVAPPAKQVLKKQVSNAIWIGANVENLSCEKAIITDAKNFVYDEGLEERGPLSKNDFIQPNIEKPKKLSQRQIIHIGEKPAKNNLWKPQEKQVDLFNNEFVTPPSQNVPHSQDSKIHNSQPPKVPVNNAHVLHPHLRQTSRTSMNSSIAYQYRFEGLYARNRLGNLYFCQNRNTNDRHLALILHRQYSFASVSTLQSLAKLRHRYILPVKDIGLHKGHTVVFMAVDRITPLRMYIKENDLSIQQKLYLVQALITAIEYAHSYNIRHGNLSMSNIFMDPQGCPKIMGFAVRKTKPTHIPANGLKQLSSALPNRLRISKKDKRNDLVAIGYILFELLTGKAALRRDTMNKLRRRSDLQEVSFPKHLQKTIPRQLQFICLKSVDTRADYGYETLHDLKEEINSLLQNDHHDEKWGFYSYRLKTWWGKHRDRANVYFIGIAIFMSLWLVPSNLKVPSMFDPNAKAEEQIIAELIEDLQSNDKVTCVLAIKKAAELGESAKNVLPLLQRLTWRDEAVISENAHDAIAAIRKKINGGELQNLDSDEILAMLQNRFSDKRRQGLDAVEKLEKVENPIIESLLSIASFDASSHIRDKAKSILEKIKLTENNFVTFTKLLRNRTTHVKRLVLKKVLASSAVDKENIIRLSIEFLDDYNSYNRGLAISFLKKEINNEEKWIRALVPKLRKANIEMRQDIYEILGRITPIHPKNSAYFVELLREKNSYVNTYAQQAFAQIDLRYAQTTQYLLEDAYNRAIKTDKEWILRGLAENDYKCPTIIPLLEKALRDPNVSVRKWGAICAGRMRRMAVPLIPELEALLKGRAGKEAQKALDKIR